MLWWNEIRTSDLGDVKYSRNNKRIEHVNLPCGFDIETTSITSNEEKHAFMYIWMFGFNDTVYYGRTWEEFISFTDILSSRLELNPERRLIIYVHNLAFEFQFIYKLFEWESVFSLRKHKPIYARTNGGFEFRCSYLLSGLNLQKVGENLRNSNIRKQVGTFDYNLIRHHETEITEIELNYCEHDVLVILEYIREQIEEHKGNINYIPLTNTGRVRNYCRKQTLYKNYDDYHTLMKGLVLEVDEYLQLKRGFQGGFTHASYAYSGRVVNDVTSYDFASSYPYVMVSERFPMTAPKLIDNPGEELDFYLDKYACIFDIELWEVSSITLWEHPLSESRCYKSVGTISDNGRVVYSQYVKTTITEQDYFTLREYYEWGNAEITNFRIMKKEYLPRSFILAILNLYSDKTTLKDVEGKEAEYMRSKNMINSCYGMTVTDIARPEITFQSTGWDSSPPDIDEVIEKYNKSKRRFLYYPWGVWVTAYARRNLFNGISEFKTDYIYSDTDSVKVINAEKHKDYIERYNSNVLSKLRKMCHTYGIDFEMCQPKAPSGKKKPLGVWDFDGHYKKFKTLGAKRYMTLDDNDKLSITVAGVNKKSAVPYLLERYDDPFEAFNDGLKIPPEHTGKLTHTYIDDSVILKVKDYRGKRAEVLTYSGVHLEPASYELSLSDMYIKYLCGYYDDTIL